MAINKYRKRILNMGKEASARILLPEIGDKRIQEASAELTSLGFDILYYQDFQDRMDIYLDYINSLPFTKNWPAENLHQYLSDPLHFAMAMVACDDADGLAAGAVTPSGDVIRAAIRMIGIRSALANFERQAITNNILADTDTTDADKQIELSKSLKKITEITYELILRSIIKIDTPNQSIEDKQMIAEWLHDVGKKTFELISTNILKVTDSGFNSNVEYSCKDCAKTNSTIVIFDPTIFFG